MENVRSKYEMNGMVASNCVVNPSENEFDDDVILVEKEIPIIDLRTPDVERQPRMPFTNLYNQGSGGQQRVGQRNFFRRMNNADTATVSEPPNNSSIVYQRSANHGKGPLQEFLDSVMRQANNAPENPPVKCKICLRSAIGREPQSTFCGHVFCKFCIKRAMIEKKECPTCKKQISVVHPLYI